MRSTVKIFIFVFFLASFLSAQELSREQKLQRIEELHGQIKNLAEDFLLPNTKDLSEAKKKGLEAFRILPRGMLNGKVGIREGGAYYSFTTKSHDYDDISQIGLEQNNLKVGFAGADYGFIADLGEIPLADISKETSEANFLVNYKPPANISDIRIEQRKTWNYEADGITYKNSLPAVVGHTYVLRAISFDEADILVTFNVYRKDTDGSLIIFWKPLEIFDVPKINRDIEEK